MKKRTFTLALLLVAMLVARAADLVTLPAGVQPEEYTLKISHRIYQDLGQYQVDEKEINANVAIVGTDVYLSGLAYYFPSAYVKGTLADGKATFESGQFVGSDQFGEEYLTSYVVEDGKGIITPFVFFYDEATRTLTFDESVSLSETNEMNGGGFYADVVSATYTPGGLPPLVPVTVPGDLVTRDYLLVGTNIYYDEDDNGERVMVEEKYDRPLSVGFDGDDLYIRGIVENVPQGWVKATKNSQGNYVVPSGQYVGTWKFYNLVNDYFITSLNRNNKMTDLTLTYNEADGSLTTSQNIALSSSATKAEIYYYLSGVSLRPVVEREATPATPEFTFSGERSPYAGTMWYYADFFVPATDVDGNPMVTDKLSFTFFKTKDGVTTPVTFPAGSGKYYMLKEDLTEIPYGFTDGLEIGLHTIYFEKLGEEELRSWSRLGLQSTYRGNGVEHQSEIFWFDMDAFWGQDGIETVQAPVPAGSQAVYSLSGQRLKSPRKGLNIIGGRKVLVK